MTLLAGLAIYMDFNNLIRIVRILSFFFLSQAFNNFLDKKEVPILYPGLERNTLDKKRGRFVCTLIRA